MKITLEKLSKIYGRKIKDDDHIIKYELEMSGCEWTPENAKAAAYYLLKQRKIFEDDMNSYLFDTLKYAPCDNSGRMPITLTNR